VIKSRIMRWAGHMARRETEGVYIWFLVGIPEGKSTLARPMVRWKDNIKMDLREVGWGA